MLPGSSFTLGSSEGVEQTCSGGQFWHEPSPATEYIPFGHKVGGPISEQLKPAGQGAHIEGHADTAELRLQAYISREKHNIRNVTYM